MLISETYRHQNVALHAINQLYGTSGHKLAAEVLKWMRPKGMTTLLDYGCGKGTLKNALMVDNDDLDIREYDPCVAGKDAIPDVADFVVCNDVLEHIEPEYLDAVLRDIHRVMGVAGILVASTVPALKTLPDGRNAHLIIEPMEWWREKVREHFRIIAKGGDARECLFVVERK